LEKLLKKYKGVPILWNTVYSNDCVDGRSKVESFTQRKLGVNHELWTSGFDDAYGQTG